MHLEGYFQKKSTLREGSVRNQEEVADKDFISLEEIDKIINSTFYANQGNKVVWKKRKTARESYYAPPAVSNNSQKEIKEEFLLVDGYNVIYAWTELAELAEDNMDAARIKLLEALSNYQGIRKCQIIVVFDAYRVLGHKEEIIDYHNIHMVYTGEAQTADQYIEKFAHDNRSKYRITVATSDGLQQIIIRGAGSDLLSARELREEIVRANERIMAAYEEMQQKGRSYLLDSLSPEMRKRMEDLLSENESK
jgi:predicted RNA-binding protein with PIN domain